MKPRVVSTAVGAAFAAAALLSGCGNSGQGASPTTLPLTATNYVTITQTPTTLTPTTLAAGNPGMVHPEQGTYTITDAAEDAYASRLARKFKVKLEDLLSINNLSLDANGFVVPAWPGPGTVIQLPPGWTEPGATADTTPTGTTPQTETTTTIAGGQSACQPGEYTILAEDTSKIKVANKLDTTVEALDAANVNTQGYSSFYPGLKIKTPPKQNC